MGVKIGFLGALIFEVFTKLVNVVGALNPANLGSYEGGNMLIAKMFGLTGAVGLSVAFDQTVTGNLLDRCWRPLPVPSIQIQSP